MSHPVIVVLAAVFALLSASFAYILVRGLRAGRFSLRFTTLDTTLKSLAFRKHPVPGGRDPGYCYRDDDATGFWIEAAVRLLAVIICVIMFIVLLTAP